FRYARPAKTWEFYLSFSSDVGPLLERNPDAFIGHVLSTEAAALVERLTVPVVETSFARAEMSVPRVCLDDRAIGVLAAEHFLNLGFTQFVYLGETDMVYTQRRREGFEARLCEAGHQATPTPKYEVP